MALIILILGSSLGSHLSGPESSAAIQSDFLFLSISILYKCPYLHVLLLHARTEASMTDGLCKAVNNM